MKLPLHLLLLTTPSTSLLSPTFSHVKHHLSSTSLKYKPTDEDNVFNVLANTERWICETLERSNESAREAKKKMHYADDLTPGPMDVEGSASSVDGSSKADSVEGTAGESQDNPYARKEVTYVCETGDEICGVVGGIFRRVREARELGERHGMESGGKTTMRNTNVVVIPNCSELSEFKTFDKMVQAINMARRSARDFNFKKDESDNQDWVISINCAHLHPHFGELSPEEQLEAMKAEESSGEIDVNLIEYKKRRDEARRSPYPSVIVEVQSTPPPEFSAAPKKMTYIREEGEVLEDPVTSEDIQRLEAIFGMSPSAGKKDNDFYDALGEAFGDQQIAARTPLRSAQDWVLANDQDFDEATSTFTTSNTRHIDAAYEYVFNTLAMISAESPKQGQKSYIVLPEFLPNSSYSFDQFASLVFGILQTVPTSKDKVSISTFHPEHVDASHTSPVPIFVVTWQ